MSLFDLQDVCIAIGSIATLDLPMVVDLIGIYGMKGPYRPHNGCGPTASCIPEPLSVTQVLDSRFPHGYSAQCFEHTKRYLGVRLPKKKAAAAAATVRRRCHRAPPPPPLFAGKSFPANLDEENPSAPISSGLLVQADEGIPSPVVDLIDDIYRLLP
ncbi:hypothetical protein F511_36188 [Dorcoceras hygrometricum]|uniref:Uncharacterized protein n=1 Tax=Dorcoceras hygrometricum TaxID=472368 RepID=A0A2Z7AYH1_9LAMI|nr:hypothetical protein F511_36188 [Dorcoceras hygrometricum]